MGFPLRARGLQHSCFFGEGSGHHFKAVWRARCWRGRSSYRIVRVEGVQHEPEENVQKPVEGVHDPVEGVHDPVEGVHDPVEGVDAVEGVVDAFALALLLALSFLSALALFLISSRRGSSRRE